MTASDRAPTAGVGEVIEAGGDGEEADKEQDQEGRKKELNEAGITRRTASQHVATILAKLEAELRTAAVTRAVRLGILATSLPEHP